MNVDWEAADRLYQQMFGEPLAVKVCREEIELVDDGAMSDADLIELLDLRGDISKGQLDCIAVCLR